MTRSTVPSPGRLGLVEASAPEDLKTLGWLDKYSVSLLWALSRAADADLALKTLIRLRAAFFELDGTGRAWAEIDGRVRGDQPFRARLLAVLGASRALGDHLVANPTAWQVLLTPIFPTRARLQEILLRSVQAQAESGPTDGDPVWRAELTGTEAVKAMSLAYRNELLVLAAHDLAATIEDEPVIPYRVVGQHLSDLADAGLAAALAVAVATVCTSGPCPARVAVIAMGKCGARELNYISDVDVVFVAEPASPIASRIAGEMMRLGTNAFFEVDAALRPEGRSGELVRTIDSHVAYYRRWAKTWEFQALLKARPMVGDMTLGEQYYGAVMPMVWVASEREDFVPEVQQMRRRVEGRVPEALREREIKVGSGGLRDVEFAVQLLQLVHGRADESLRVANTVLALEALAEGGYVSREDAANLIASYEFLRLLEHRLQLQRLRRTHTLPEETDHEARRWLARAANVRPTGRHDALGVLNHEIRRNALRIRRIHAKLFYRPLLDSVAGLGREALTLTPEAAIRQLSALGYRHPAGALEHLKALSASPLRKGRVQAVLLPTLLSWLGDTPDPDAGLLAYRNLCDALADQDWFLRQVRDEGALAQRLMIILGSSALVPTLLMNAPEVIKSFADGPDGPMLLNVRPEDVARGLISSAARYDRAERAVAVARSLRRHELARVASADVLGLLDVHEVCRALSSVWAAVLNAALDAVIDASELDRGSESPADIAVIGMGRLGGFELGYGSDADVLFVCQPRDGVVESDAVRWANSIAESVTRLLGAPSVDPALVVDAGLRPEGRSGPLVRTLSAYRAYYEQWAQPWEVQALLRAHQIAGDDALGVQFLHLIDPIRYVEGGISAAGVREIRRIKARVDSERLPRGADPATHTKLGRGGLSDIEWTVQLIQLRHAHLHPELHNTSTIATLAAIKELGLLDAQDVEQLRASWLLATRTRNALVLVRGRPTDQLPSSGPLLGSVARLLTHGRQDSQEFLDEYLKVTRRARNVVERIFGA